MSTINNNWCCVVDKPVRTFVTYGRIRFMNMIDNILITYFTFFFACGILPVEFCTDILPGGSCQNISFIIDNCRWKRINFIQFILKHLKLINVNQILQLIFFHPD